MIPPFSTQPKPFPHYDPLRAIQISPLISCYDFKSLRCQITFQLQNMISPMKKAFLAPYDAFERLVSRTLNTFQTSDERMKELTIAAREVTKKRNEQFIPIKITPAHAKLQERTRYLREWQKQHEQLVVMTGPTLKGLGGVGMEVGGMDMEEEVKEAYETVKRIDMLDVSIGMCFNSQFIEIVVEKDLIHRGNGDMG